MKFIALVAVVAYALAANAETYHVKRGGMDNCRVALKADRRGYQWLSFAAYDNSWSKKGILTDYP